MISFHCDFLCIIKFHYNNFFYVLIRNLITLHQVKVKSFWISYVPTSLYWKEGNTLRPSSKIRYFAIKFISWSNTLTSKKKFPFDIYPINSLRKKFIHLKWEEIDIWFSILLRAPSKNNNKNYRIYKRYSYASCIFHFSKN